MVRKIYFLVGLAVLLGMIISPLVLTAGPLIEGRFFPVTGRATISQIVQMSDIKTRIWGKADKLRECTFVRLEWFYAPAQGTPVVAPIEFIEGTQSRGSGQFTFGPWEILLSQRQLKNGSYAYAFHRCHPLWLTRTLFFSTRG